LLASCSATGEPTMELAQATEAGAPVADLGSDDAAAGAPPSSAKTAASDKKTSESASATAAEPEAVTEKQTAEAVLAAAKDKSKDETGAEKQQVGAATDDALPPSPTGQVLENGGPILTAGTMPEPAPRKKSFLSSFFGSTPADAKFAAAAPDDPKPAAATREAKAKPVITLPDQNVTKRKEDTAVRLAALGARDDGVDDRSGDFSLPGVRRTNLFEIKRKSGIDDDSDIDVYEDIGSYEVASAAGMARLAPNGLLKQRETVDTACLKPKLVRMLKQIEQHFGKRLIVTSGYRSPSYNKKVRGAEKSQHMYCAAVDVQMPGVAKFELARYARAMRGRGGVGTYCHSSIHIDIGPERDWNWKCAGRKT
jgi:uncharacterized protein YcbK (DUF882 family)